MKQKLLLYFIFAIVQSIEFYRSNINIIYIQTADHYNVILYQELVQNVFFWSVYIILILKLKYVIFCSDTICLFMYLFISVM